MSFEETFKNWTLDQKVEWALGKNICISENMRSIIVDLKDENERMKKENENLKKQLKKDGEWLCNGNEQNNGFDDNQSWGIFG